MELLRLTFSFSQYQKIKTPVFSQENPTRFFIFPFSCVSFLSPFSSVSIFHLFQVFWCCSTTSATDLRKFFYSQACFLRYTPPHLTQYCECDGFERAVITQMFLILHSSRHLAQLAFIKASLGARSFSLEVAWLSTEV